MIEEIHHFRSAYALKPRLAEDHTGIFSSRNASWREILRSEHDYVLYKQAAVPLTTIGKACGEDEGIHVSWRLMPGMSGRRWEMG